MEAEVLVFAGGKREPSLYVHEVRMVISSVMRQQKLGGGREKREREGGLLLANRPF